MNLFLATRRLTAFREDHLTEFIAAALNHAPQFCDAYAQLLLGDFALRQGWPKPVIDRVETQVDFAGEGCRPDALLRLQGGKVVVCEHKLDAPETFGEDDRGQLERYLKLPGVDGVAYMREALRPPEPEVLEHPKYIRPSTRPHFLWYDVFPLLRTGEHVLVDWLREGFEDMELTPPSDTFRKPTLRPHGEQVQQMRDFGKYWDPVRSHAAECGWRLASGSHDVEVYLLQHPNSPVVQIFATPIDDEIRVQFTPASGHLLDEVRGMINPELARLPGGTRMEDCTGSWKDVQVRVVRVRASHRAVLGEDQPSAEVIQKRLLAFVGPLVRSISGERGRDPFPKAVAPTVRRRPSAS